MKKSKFAFPILHLEELVEGVSLSVMREKLNVNPPQSFFYLDSFPELETYIKGLKKTKIY
ncbi:MAG: hypothetical protein ACMXYK_03335 [Candidatus Woesearchaeota archaeon]